MSAPLHGSGCGWVDRKVRELRGAREFLTGIGLAPRPAGGDRYGRDKYATSQGWRLPFWSGVFTDDMLIDMARERGFDPGSVHG